MIDHAESLRTTSQIATQEDLKPSEAPPSETNLGVSHEAGSMEQNRTVVPSLLSKRDEGKNLAAISSLLKEVGRALKLARPLLRDVNEILGGIEAWLLCFYSYGFDFTRDQPAVLRKVLKTSIAAADCGTISGWMSYFKYKNAAFMAANTPDQVSPPLPHPRFPKGNDKYLFGGPFVGFQLALFRRGPEFRYSFATSILQSKKGMPRPSDADVEKAREQNFRTMTSPKPETKFSFRWDPIFEDCTYEEPPLHTMSRWDLEHEIRRTVRELFRTWRLDLEALTRIFLPSSSSDYNRTRTQMGTYGELEELAIFDEFRRNPDSKLKFTHRMTKLYGYVSEYYGDKGQKDVLENIDMLKEAVGGEVDCTSFLKSWKKFYWGCVKLALEEPPLVEIVGLKEALKIRCISKGPPLLYFVLKPIQKSLWGQLQKTWNFELTGTPITEELMNKRFRQYIGRRFHSGDYKAATDELHSYCSDVANEELWKVAERNTGLKYGCFPELLKRALTGHTYIHHDRFTKVVSPFIETATTDEIVQFMVGLQHGESSKEVTRWLEAVPKETAEQKRGQLMGSPVSFPFLCILNATLIRKTYEMAEGVVAKIRDCPFWINGDDCLTAYTGRRFPEYWRGLGSIMGFTESVGKTYDSTEFCSINSTTFMVEEGRWKLVPYVNLGLIAGYGRSSAATQKPDSVNPFELATLQRELLEMGPKDQLIRERMDFLFRNRNKNSLGTFPGSYYLPTWAGGLGMTPPCGYTKELRAEAGFVRYLLGTSDLEVPSVPTDKSWIHFDLFNRRIREELPLVAKYSFEEYERQEDYGAAFCSVVWEEYLKKGSAGLYKPHQDKWKWYQNKMLKFRRKLTELRGQPGVYRIVKRVKAHEMVQEVKATVLPIWGEGQL